MSQFLQIVKRGLSSHCLHECQDHWKWSLMAVELTSKDVRVCFYNFIRIFFRQKHPPQKPHHPFPRKGFHHLKTDAINSTKGQVPILLNSACIQHLLDGLPHARWDWGEREREGHSPSTQAFKIISRQHLAKSLNTFITIHAWWGIYTHDSIYLPELNGGRAISLSS